MFRRKNESTHPEMSDLPIPAARRAQHRRPGSIPGDVRGLQGPAVQAFAAPGPINPTVMDDAPFNRELLELMARAEGPTARRALTQALQATNGPLQAAVLGQLLSRRQQAVWAQVAGLLPALDDPACQLLRDDAAMLEPLARVGMSSEDPSVRLNVVNLLASQWGEMFSNVGDFDGRTTHGATDSAMNGEFLVRVGTENRMQVLGHISLLGYSGQMIHPLCTGGPSESAIGDPLEVTMADWARRCREQNGLVVMPHAPNPQCERAADIVLGVVHAMEMMTFNPYNEQINPYGIADWYRFLNLGYQLPVVGGSDKMAASSLLGGVRTYTQLGERPFTYENWMEATRAGHTFVTVGPLIDMDVQGNAPGSQLQLPKSGGTLNVSWQAESVRVPICAVEVVVGGETVEVHHPDDAMTARGSTDIKVDASTWIAVRIRGSYHGRDADIAAHTSTVHVSCGKQPIYAPKDAMDILKQIEGAIAFVDTIAPRPEADAYRKLRLTLESAWNTLHQRMHQQGNYHEHSPLHDHAEHHEH